MPPAQADLPRERTSRLVARPLPFEVVGGDAAEAGGARAVQERGGEHRCPPVVRIGRQEAKRKFLSPASGASLSREVQEEGRKLGRPLEETVRPDRCKPLLRENRRVEVLRERGVAAQLLTCGVEDGGGFGAERRAS